MADAAAFRTADPDGFLVAEVDGTPAASLSIVRFGDATAFLGLYICRPDLRGQGWATRSGRRGWRALRRHHGARRRARQQANYARSGFAPVAPEPALFGHTRAAGVDRTLPLGPSHLDAALALDRAVTGFDRATFFRDWLTEIPRAVPCPDPRRRAGRAGGASRLRGGIQGGPDLRRGPRGGRSRARRICDTCARRADQPRRARTQRRRDGHGRGAGPCSGFRNSPHVARPGPLAGSVPNLRRHHLRTGLKTTAPADCVSVDGGPGEVDAGHARAFRGKGLSELRPAASVTISPLRRGQAERIPSRGRPALDQFRSLRCYDIAEKHVAA